MRDQEIAVALTSALMTGEPANGTNADKAVILYRRILMRLKEPERIVDTYRGEPGVEVSR